MTIKTMLAAAAVTIGMLAHGALPSGTSFETLSAGASVGKAALEAADEGATWTLPADQTVTAWGDEIYPATRPKQFVDVGTGTENYLGIKTTLGEYVSRNVGQQTIGDGGLYVDTLVKFTAADEDIAVPSDAKIGVWVKTNEDETENRLMISAAPFNDGAATVYDCGVLDAADAWKRLTVKAIYNIDGNGALGFVVYVDGVAVGCEATKAAFAGKTLTANAAKFMNEGLLFASIVDSNKLSEIAVSGQGGIDDISFTATAPDFAKDFEFISLTFDPAKIATLYVTDGETTQSFTSSPASYLVETTGDKSYYYDAQPGYISVGSDKAIAIKGTSVEIADPAAAAFKIGETAYASWADAVAAAVDGAKTISLVADYEMTETDLAASIENTMLTTLDLNGKTLTGCVVYKSALTITDTAETGVIAPADGLDYVVTLPEDWESETYPALAIAAGKFAGMINAGDVSAMTVIGGVFYDADGEYFQYAKSNPWTVADVGNFEAVYAANYWTVQEAAAPTTAEVTISAENVTVTVMAGETPVVSGESVEVGTVLTITATPATDYELATLTVKGAEFTSGSTYTVVEGDAGNTIAIAATATAIPYVAQVGETNKYRTLAEAWTAAKAASDADAAVVLKLLDDVEAPGFGFNANSFTKNGFVLDLGGKVCTLTSANQDIAKASDPIDIRTNNIVTIKNGTVTTSKAFRDIIRHYGNERNTLTIQNVTFDGTKLESGKTTKANCIVNIEGCDTVTITGSTFTSPESVTKNAFYAIKIGNHANPDEYSVGTVTFGAGTTVNGDVLISGGTYVEAGSPTINGDVYFGHNANSTWTDGVTSEVFEARIGTIAETGAEDNFGGKLYRTLEAAIAAAKAGDTISIAKASVTKADIAITASTATTLAIAADVTLTATTSLALNGAKVALAEGGTLVAPAALNIADDFVAPGEGLEIKVAGEGPYTYTVGEAAPKGIEPGQSIGLGNPGTMTLEQAQTEAAKLPIALTTDDTAAGLTTDSLCVKAVLIGGAYQAVVDVKPELAPAVDATAETPIEVGAANFSATVKNPVKGLYYYFTASATVDGTYAPAGDAVRAGDTGVTLTAPKGGAASFYKLNVAVRPPVK